MMDIPQPSPFALTLEEAAAVQSEQARRQTVFAEEGASYKVLPLAVPAFFICVITAVDRLLVGGALPVWFYISVCIAYLMGLFVQLAVMAKTLSETKHRMLMATPQVWEERTIRLERGGLVQDTSSSRAHYNWSAFQSVTRDDAFIWLWLTAFNAVVVPLRAFASGEEADAFFAEAERQREALT